MRCGTHLESKIPVPRKILLLNTDLELGGTPTVIYELATRLHNPPDVVVHVACLKQWGPMGDRLKQAHIATASFDAMSPLQFTSTLVQLIEHIRDHEFDTVLSFLMHANFMAAQAAKSYKGKVRFFQSIQTTQPTPRWHWWLQRRAKKQAEKIIVPSLSVAEVAQKRAGVKPDRRVIIPNAVDIPVDFPAFSSPLPGEKFPIGFLGRLDPIKRVGLFVEACAILRNQVIGHIFGDGPDRPEIEALIAKHDLQNQIIMHGMVASPSVALKQIGALVLPSENEGMPMVLIEAMAHRVPVIGFDVPGVRDVIQDNVNGLLVKTNLPETIQKLIADNELRQKLVDGGLHSVQSQYNWNHAIEMYRQVLGIDGTTTSASVQ